MRQLLQSNRGSALVAAMFFILALGFTGMIITWVTSSSRRVSHNEYAYARAFYSSDAGSEAALNWIRLQTIPPPTVLLVNGDQFVMKDSTYSYIQSDHKYKADVKHKIDPNTGRVVRRHRPGWDSSWQDFEYIVDSYGESADKSSTRIEVQAARLFRLDYSY